MVLPAIFNVIFYNRQGQKINIPKEWDSVFLQIDLQIEEWDQSSLYINFKKQDLFLKKINGEIMLVTDFIRLNAGYYQLTFKYQNQVSHHRFTIYPKKISTDSYRTMLEDLVYGLPADISVSMDYLGAFSGINISQHQKATIGQEVLRFKRAWFGSENKIGLSKILDNISNKPYHVLQTNEIWVKGEEVRNPNTSKIVQSMIRAQNINSAGRPSKVIDNRVENSYNVYENQMLKLYVHQFQMKLLRMVKFFKVTNNENMQKECEEILKSCYRSMKKASFLEHVDLPINFHFKTTMVLLNVPVYRAAMDGFLEFQKVITTNIDNDEIDSPLENTPSLYQKWGTLKVLAILLRLAQNFGYTMKKQRIEAKVIGGKTIRVLPDGKPALVLFHPVSQTTVKFIPECSYTKRGNVLKSISYTQKPDISIEVTAKDGKTKVYLFDPKYKLDSEEMLESEDDRTFKPKKVDIDKMHSYRDAIRDQDGNRVVEFASILYPGDTVIYNEGLSAIRSYPNNKEDCDSVLENILLRILKTSL